MNAIIPHDITKHRVRHNHTVRSTHCCRLSSTRIYAVSYDLLLLVWHAPLGVRSAKRRHQSPEWTILSHSYRLIQ